MTELRTGDVALDLTQGRPVHVLFRHDADAGEWSDRNNYELCDNYGNRRLGATDDDAVLEVVYCSSAKSEPSKTYAMPESRLLRIETEQADDGLAVRERIRRDLLDELFQACDESGMVDATALEAVAGHAGVERFVIDEARELADAAQLGADE